MRQPNIPTKGVTKHVTKYQKFRGVDFSTDPSQIDKSRSPYSVNLISDTGGNPEKRLGWRELYTVESPINGLFYGVIEKVGMFIVHGGTKLYKWDCSTAPVEIGTGYNNARSQMIAMNGKFWIFTGAEYLSYDGETVKNVTEDAYIPTTIIARLPTGGGEAYESVNLLSKFRYNLFAGDASATEFQLDSTDISTDTVEAWVDDVQKTENTDFTVDRTAGKVTFTTAPGKPAVAGQDNVKIKFGKEVEGYTDRILKCNICTTYGIGSNDRIFVAGNPDYLNTDWYSQINDPSYFADLNYSNVGTDQTAIMGYRRLGQYQAIVKEENEQDSTVFLRQAATSTSGDNVLFPLQQSISGIGAISKYAFADLVDEPLFLSRQGVYAITTNLLTSDRMVQNRSAYIDPQLLKEPNLKDAFAIQWNGYYCLFLGDHVYILDGKQPMSRRSSDQNNTVYECYYWEGVPAVVALEHDGVLYFGTAGGSICRLNDDIELMTKYSDQDSTGNRAITAIWSTMADDDGDFTVRKTMVKRGCGVMIKPYTRSSVKVLFRTDKDAVGKEIKHELMDIFDWEDIDFSRFSFLASDSPQVVMFNRKVKKYITLQIIVKNDTINEGFGVFGIIKRYTKGSYVK